MVNVLKLLYTMFNRPVHFTQLKYIYFFPEVEGVAHRAVTPHSAGVMQPVLAALFCQESKLFHQDGFPVCVPSGGSGVLFSRPHHRVGVRTAGSPERAHEDGGTTGNECNGVHRVDIRRVCSVRRDASTSQRIGGGKVTGVSFCREMHSAQVTHGLEDLKVADKVVRTVHCKF